MDYADRLDIMNDDCDIEGFPLKSKHEKPISCQNSKIKNIEYITEESGNWCVLIVPKMGKMENDFRYEGHSIPEQIWLDLFKMIGYQVN